MSEQINRFAAEEEDAGRRAEHASSVENGLDNARKTLAEIWRRHSGAGNDSLRDLTWEALGAVIEAQATMLAADAFVSNPCRKSHEALAALCVTRVTPALPPRRYRARREGAR